MLSSCPETTLTRPAQRTTRASQGEEGAKELSHTAKDTEGSSTDIAVKSFDYIESCADMIRSDTTKMRQTTDIKKKKRIGRRGGKRKRKYVTRRKRYRSPPGNIIYAEQANNMSCSYSAPEFPRETLSIRSSTRVLQCDAFDQAYQETLWSLAISMKRSAFSRMRVIQNCFPISTPTRLQTKLS